MKFEGDSLIYVVFHEDPVTFKIFQVDPLYIYMKEMTSLPLKNRQTDPLIYKRFYPLKIAYTDPIIYKNSPHSVTRVSLFFFSISYKEGYTWAV